MRRTAAIAALALATSACTTVFVDDPDLDPCTDLTVGDQVQWVGYRILGADFLPEAAEVEWLLTGPGTLEVGPAVGDAPPEERATYFATEPGEVFVLNRLTEFELLPLDRVSLGISTWARVSEMSCTFEVTTPTTTTAPATELSYDVTQRVTRSSTGLGLGTEADIEWVFQFDCADARCDGRLRIGSSPFYDVVYQPSSEEYAISLDIQSSDDQCPTGTTSGVVTPSAWDEVGPVEFRGTRQSVLACSTGDVVTEFEDAGRRR